MLFCFCYCCRAHCGGAAAFAPADGSSGAAPLPALPGVPDTALAHACDAYLASISGSVMVRHCKRAYFFAHALAVKGGLRPDLEVLYIGCQLHDLGLEAEFDGPGDFEVNGARAATAFLTLQAAPEAFASAVAQAIELHTDVASATHARAEVACLHMGTMMDVFGARIDQIDARFVQRVVAEYPRAGTKALIADLLGRQIREKPESRIGMIGRTIDVPARAHAAPFED